ncbi:MAG: alpha/beta fold hydrolase [Casimicrobiaceae bacterium]
MTPRPFASHAAWLLAAALASAGCADTRAPARTLTLADCHLPKLAQTLSCGTLEVPENRAMPAGRKLALSVIVLPANTLSPKPDPLFVLAGGPGQAASSIADFAATLSDVRTTRDIVLVDQRGTGRSAPLDCAAFRRDAGLAAALEADPRPRAAACAAELMRRGVDLTQYTTTTFIADLEDVRRALAYPRINLWGGSYGTRVAQEYVRRHADVIRSVVLDGVAPPRMIVTLDVWPTREHVIDGVIAACARSPACNAAHPALSHSLATIEQALGPQGRDITLAMPRNGEAQSLHLTFDALLSALQLIVYQPEMAALLPEILSRAERGDYAPLLALLAMFDDSFEDSINAALHYSVTCAEDVPRITPAARERVLANATIARLVSQLIDVCGAWPRGAMPADFATPLASDIPMLLLSGGLDPVTPPAYAAEVAATLQHAKSIVAPGYGHIVSSHGCAPRLVARFIDSAGFDTLPQSCIEHLAHSAPPLLWPDRLGARP